MRRRGFLGSMAAFALAPLGRPALADDEVRYDLTAASLAYAPAPGVSVNAVAYNGSIPGPVLRVRYGQRLRVHYTNRSPIQTTVHWHGMVLPNGMDGAAGVTQRAVMPGGTFEYAYAPDPPGTRWYHDHAEQLGSMRGLFGMIIVEDPRDEPADAEFAVVFHGVPQWSSVQAAIAGKSSAPMIDPMGSQEMAEMKPGDRMGDEVHYLANCINGTTYPNGKPLQVNVGDRVRLRILNASGTQTQYVRLAGHRLRVTHADGNPVPTPAEFDVLRLGVAERYDAWFEVTKPGAWLLQGVSSDPLAYQQAVVIATPGANVAPLSAPQTVDGLDVLSYEKLAGGSTSAPLDVYSTEQLAQIRNFTLGGGGYGSNRWTMDGKTWPNIPPIEAKRGDHLLVRFKNTTDMDHPMHLHGHTFLVMEIDGKRLIHPLAKDTTLVGANGGTMTWHIDADNYPGRWLLHCHNEIHMTDGMMTELRYV